MLLLNRLSLLVLVTEDKMDLVRGTALVRAKHDSVRSVVLEARWSESLVSGNKLEVSTTARETVSELDIELEHQRLLACVNGLWKGCGNAIMPGLLSYLS